MKRIAFISVVTALFVLSPTRSMSQDTGMQLQAECEASLTTQKVSPSNSSDDYMKGAHCMGEVGGIAATLTLWKETNKMKKLPLDDIPACLPKGGTNGEYIRVVLHYLNEHPDKLHFSYEVLIFLALQDAYPCNAAAQ